MRTSSTRPTAWPPRWRCWSSAPRGDHQTQIATVMHAAGVSPEQQAAAWKQFDASLLATAHADGISLDVANAIWLQKGLPFDPAFLNTLATDFASPSSLVDFSGNPQGAGCAHQQMGKCRHPRDDSVVVGASDIQTAKLVLADAIYFDAHWKNQLLSTSHRRSPSSCLTNQVMANMMQGGPWTLPAYIGAGVTAVELPYVGGHFAADVIMPTSENIGAFVASMTLATLTSIDQQLTPIRPEYHHAQIQHRVVGVADSYSRTSRHDRCVHDGRGSQRHRAEQPAPCWPATAAGADPCGRGRNDRCSGDRRDRPRWRGRATGHPDRDRPSLPVRHP